LCRADSRLHSSQQQTASSEWLKTDELEAKPPLKTVGCGVRDVKGEVDVVVEVV
jgi:hypothetical protein